MTFPRIRNALQLMRKLYCTKISVAENIEKDVISKNILSSLSHFILYSNFSF